MKDDTGGAVVPTHGGGRITPWRKGQSGNPRGPAPHTVEARRLAREATPDAVRELVVLLADPDPRIRLLAANSILDRGLGKPKPPAEGDGGPVVINVITGVPEPDG